MESLVSQVVPVEIAKEYIMHLMAICSMQLSQAQEEGDLEMATAFYARRAELATELRSLHPSQAQRIEQIRSRYGFLINDFHVEQHASGASAFEQDTMDRYCRQMALAG